MAGLETGRESKACRISWSSELRLFFFSFFHISPCPFPSGFDHRFSFVCSSLSIFDQCLSLISMFLSFLLSPVHDYYIMGHRVWTMSGLMTVLSQSISCQTARWVSTIGASNHNQFTRVLGKLLWKAGGPWLRTSLCNQGFKKIIFK